MSPYILCKILSFQTKITEKVLNTYKFTVKVILDIQFWCFGTQSETETLMLMRQKLLATIPLLGKWEWGYLHKGTHRHRDLDTDTWAWTLGCRHLGMDTWMQTLGHGPLDTNTWAWTLGHRHLGMETWTQTLGHLTLTHEHRHMGMDSWIQTDDIESQLACDCHVGR